MHNSEDIINKLISFQKVDKFSESAWEKRGLNPSSYEMCTYLQQFFNDCAAELINAIRSESSSRMLKSVLKNNLRRLNKFEYDTEEREFICDLFDQLQKIVNVEFSDNLNGWLYGRAFNILHKLGDLFNRPGSVEVQLEPCSQCEVELETHIFQKEEGIDNAGWMIVRCQNCKELNLLSLEGGIKRVKFVNYELIETLSEQKYNYEQALIRLEQIRTYRK